jgi:hypothetical protein
MRLPYFLLALPRRAAKKLIILVCLAFVAGCVHQPLYKAYDGPEQPAYKIVTVLPVSQYAFVWSYVAIYKVDGRTVFPRWGRVSVLPGTHRYQVIDLHRSKLAMLFGTDYFYEQAVCGFMLDAAPGTEYTFVSIDSSEQVSTEEQKVYKAQIEIEQHFTRGDSVKRRIPTECASMDLVKRGWFERRSDVIAKGFLCQTNTDCLAEGAVCIRETGYSYGVCSNAILGDMR